MERAHNVLLDLEELEEENDLSAASMPSSGLHPLHLQPCSNRPDFPGASAEASGRLASPYSTAPDEETHSENFLS